jgi:hypothetical protein
MPEYVAGLQFHSVYLIHVDAADAGLGEQSIGARRRFFSRCYPGASRAVEKLELSSSRERAGRYSHRPPCSRFAFECSVKTLVSCRRDRRKFWGLRARRPFSGLSLTWGESLAWILRLVKIGTEGEGRTRNVMEIKRPDDIADLGLTLSGTKCLLATLQKESVAAQTSAEADRSPSQKPWSEYRPDEGADDDGSAIPEYDKRDGAAGMVKREDCRA